MKRETFGSRIGFILLSAGCAIGIGNVWKFPYIGGRYGGGFFVLIYIFFLIVLGMPALSMEMSVGRASRAASVNSFRQLENKGGFWHVWGYFGIAANYLIMMFYTVVAGWMMYYLYLYLSGYFSSGNEIDTAETFAGLVGNPMLMELCMAVVCILGFLICAMGLKDGIEKVSKYVMGLMFFVMILLVVNSLLLPGAAEGIKYYLVPDIGRVMELGFFHTVVAAMNQAFFTLSIGISVMSIMGSYSGKEHTVWSDAVRIIALDTAVALSAGMIIFPACFTYDISPAAGPSLIFVILPYIFENMPGGRLWGVLFFLFMFFAAFSTVLAVFENLVGNAMELTGMSRKKVCLIHIPLMIILSTPCAFGFSVIQGSFLDIFGGTVLDFEDFLVSNLMLPFGAFVYMVFCTSRYGWGWENSLKEMNTGEGIKVSGRLRGYVTFIAPVMILVILVYGLIEKFVL